MNPVNPHPQAAPRQLARKCRLLFRASGHQMLAIGLVLAVGIEGWGCALTDKPLPAIDRAAIYGRADQYFARAVLLKPQEDATSTNLASALAPLLLQEVSDANPPAPVAPLEVYFAESQASINGIMHRQITYFWFRAAGSAKQQRPKFAQGVRITLNTRAEPVIWEIMPDPANVRIVFVSQGLEFQAAKQFGPSFPGRRFAVEQSLVAAPTVVVARVIDDGPALMGPIVHICADTGQITTLICRCMAPQAREIVATGNYQLRPVSASPLAASIMRRCWSHAIRLENHLRLPPDF